MLLPAERELAAVLTDIARGAARQRQAGGGAGTAPAAEQSAPHGRAGHQTSTLNPTYDTAHAGARPMP